MVSVLQVSKHSAGNTQGGQTSIIQGESSPLGKINFMNEAG